MCVAVRTKRALRKADDVLGARDSAYRLRREANHLCRGECLYEEPC